MREECSLQVEETAALWTLVDYSHWHSASSLPQRLVDAEENNIRYSSTIARPITAISDIVTADWRAFNLPGTLLWFLLCDNMVWLADKRT